MYAWSTDLALSHTGQWSTLTQSTIGSMSSGETARRKLDCVSLDDQRDRQPRHDSRMVRHSAPKTAPGCSQLEIGVYRTVDGAM